MKHPSGFNGAIRTQGVIKNPASATEQQWAHHARIRVWHKPNVRHFQSFYPCVENMKSPPLVDVSHTTLWRKPFGSQIVTSSQHQLSPKKFVHSDDSAIFIKRQTIHVCWGGTKVVIKILDKKLAPKPCQSEQGLCNAPKDSWSGMVLEQVNQDRHLNGI